ncbi:hypothetical protein GUJ93_ZPchr0005g15654 [Zizania palustris]|uniref:LOB domain-containing protein n=1 Tax=Zizania palustris TaxID=103762 RepID=A0A8J5VE44_ZIZPA|nr:hypothetical protein GUJ93_ZPchr0005g15654 [Zizania palustris]
MHQGLHLRALLPRRRPPKVRHRPQGLRRQQCQQDAPGTYTSLRFLHACRQPGRHAHMCPGWALMASVRSMVSCMQELPAQQRGDAVSSLVYEANARMRDPVYGCVGAISFLQNQVSQLQMQLAVAQAEILCIQMQQRDGAAQQLAAVGVGDGHHNHPLMANQLQQHQQMVVDAADSAAFLVQNGGGGGASGPPQLMSSYGDYSPAAGGGVVHYVTAQEHLKRETLWT